MSMPSTHITICAGAPAQRGMALVFCLVVLLILTMLGVSALRTSSLEQLMSGNIQELTRAFHAADSGLGKSFDSIKNSTSSADPTTFSPTSYSYGNTTNVVTAAAKTPTRIQICNNQDRNNTPSGYGTVATAYFDHQVVATTTTLANSSLRQGLTAAGAANPYSTEPCYQ